MKQTVYFGRGAVARVGAILDRLSAQRVFLVCGSHSFVESGASRALAPALSGRSVHTFREFRQNPQIDDVQTGVTAFRAGNFDVVLAVGGGSVLDMAKLVNAAGAQSSSPRDAVRGRTPLGAGGRPLIAVPTTAGSGSEATHFAVVYDGDVKYSVAHPDILPRFAVIDPDLTASLSASTTAVTGVDAFCQAVESYWSIHATPESRGLASRAFRLAWQHLPAAVSAPTPIVRRAMSKAAYLAGAAINLTKTTAAHALSYPLTSRFGIPHGQAVCLTLAPLLVYNGEATDADAADPRGARYVRDTVGEIVELLGCHNAVECRDRIRTFIGSIGLKTRFADFGLACTDTVEWVARNANVERLTNNPRALDAQSVRRLLSEVC